MSTRRERADRKEVSMTTHPRIAMVCVALIISAAAAWKTAAVAATQQAEFQGVWQTVEVTIPGAPGSASHTVKPGATLAIFHGRHYSRVEVHTDQSRAALANVMQASADEIRAVWGPFVGEAGTFQLSGSDTITMQATVAKNPADMMAGAASVYSYRRQGELLTLTQVRTPAGPAANPITVKLRRVE
jgi:hypothetical protein